MIMDDLDALLADLESTTRAQQVNLRQIENSMESPHRSPQFQSHGQVYVDVLPRVELRRGAPLPPVPASPAIEDSPSPISLRDNMQELDSMLKDLDKPEFVDNINRKSDVDGLDHDYATVNKDAPKFNDAQNTARELDELMNSLNDFKLKSRNQNENDLDRMLGSLESDLSKRGVNVSASKGLCAACDKPILGKTITALDRQWHFEHFVCFGCQTELGTSNFFEHEQRPFCETCYQQLYSPVCGFCQQPILDRCLSALEQQWHPEHFFCTSCSKPFDEGIGFLEKNRKPFCKECYYEAFAPRCAACGDPIVSNFISALNAHWHSSCFACKECGTSFANHQYFDLDGQPYCELHYHQKRGSLCSSCQQPVTRRFITALGRKWHPEHFVCTFCLQELNRGTFKERANKPYCHECFVKLFG